MAELDVTQMRLDIDSLSTNKEDKSSLKALAYKDSLAASDIPNLDASKVTGGTFAAARIPNLDASKITGGTIGTERIPNLNASKITSGSLPISNGGTGATSGNDALTNLGINDYVVASGISDDWNWRRWKSGKAECWLHIVGQGAIDNPWNGIYESVDSLYSRAYPFEFEYAPTVTATAGTLYGGAFTEVSYAGISDIKKTSPRVFALRASSTPSSTLYFDLHVIGWCK